MSQLITQEQIFPFVKPKIQDIIDMIGEQEMKREMSFAIQAANSNSYLATATPQSVGKAIFNCALTKLSLNPVLKLAYLVPKKVNGVVEAILMPSYQGYVKLITDMGTVTSVSAKLIYDGDEWDYWEGLNVRLMHKPKGKSKNIIAVYSVATLADGSKQLEFMWDDDVKAIRERSDSWKAFVKEKRQTMWVTDEGEMYRKTVVRRAFKYLPKGKNWERVAEAIKLDEQDYPATIGQIGYIESLLRTSAIDHEERALIEDGLSDMTMGEAEAMIERLSNNQLDPISAGLPYSQTDISNKIATEIHSRS